MPKDEAGEGSPDCETKESEEEVTKIPTSDRDIPVNDEASLVNDNANVVNDATNVQESIPKHSSEVGECRNASEVKTKDTGKLSNEDGNLPEEDVEGTSISRGEDMMDCEENVMDCEDFQEDSHQGCLDLSSSEKSVKRNIDTGEKLRIKLLSVFSINNSPY